MDNQQLYISNSMVKYPFDDGHTYDLGNDVVLDMCLSVPKGIIPVVTAVAITETTFFMAFEDQVTQKAIGHVILANPGILQIYQIETTMDYSFGWIVLGPGCRTPYTNRLMELALDATVVLHRPTPNSLMDTLILDGLTYDMSGELTIETSSSYVTVTAEDRVISGIPGDTNPSGYKRCIVLRRNDTNMPLQLLEGGLVEAGTSPYALVTSIAGAGPDEDGNVDITSGTIEIDVMTNASGLLISTSNTADPCPSQNMILAHIQHGRCDLGIPKEYLPLPLDGELEALEPNYLLDDCGDCEALSSGP
jgi:hypothetical protein